MKEFPANFEGFQPVRCVVIAWWLLLHVCAHAPTCARTHGHSSLALTICLCTQQLHCLTYCTCCWMLCNNWYLTWYRIFSKHWCLDMLSILALQTLNLAWKSTEELKKSKGFIDVLKFILAIGNYLNYGTRQGSAYGYKLSVLPKVHYHSTSSPAEICALLGMSNFSPVTVGAVCSNFNIDVDPFWVDYEPLWMILSVCVWACCHCVQVALFLISGSEPKDFIGLKSLRGVAKMMLRRQRWPVAIKPINFAHPSGSVPREIGVCGFKQPKIKLLVYPSCNAWLVCLRGSGLVAACLCVTVVSSC